MPYESISVFDIFKIGIGPSSSHTLGPWRASLLFIENQKKLQRFNLIKKITVLLYGSLAKTGIGHGTDIAVLLGLCGENPVTFDVEKIDSTIAAMNETHELNLNGERILSFHPKEAIVF